MKSADTEICNFINWGQVKTNLGSVLHETAGPVFGCPVLPEFLKMLCFFHYGKIEIHAGGKNVKRNVFKL